MRALAAVAILTFALAGVTGAGAADLRTAGAATRHYVLYDPIGRRAAPLIIYDYEPGVVVRAYWLPPWRHRHYFPFGRDRITRHVAWRPVRAQSYRRYWSNAWTFFDDLPPPVLRARGEVPLPRARSSAIPAKPPETDGP